MEYGNKAWSAALQDMYEKFEEEGLTQHKNWWPEIYQQACKHWNIEPDPKVLEYDMNYKDTRADRKAVNA